MKYNLSVNEEVVSMFTELVKKLQTKQLVDSGEVIAREVHSILNKHGRLTFPLPLDIILEAMQIKLFAAVALPENCSGFIAVGEEVHRMHGSKCAIFLSNEIKKGKQRFVIAHEIGHFLFDYKEDQESLFVSRYSHRNKTSFKECRATEFASELLMPRQRFLEQYLHLSRFYDLNTTTEHLAVMFGVTPKSIEYKIQDLMGV